MENYIKTAINDILRQNQGLILIFVHICISREVEQPDEHLVKLLIKAMKLQNVAK